MVDCFFFEKENEIWRNGKIDYIEYVKLFLESVYHRFSNIYQHLNI